MMPCYRSCRIFDVEIMDLPKDEVVEPLKLEVLNWALNLVVFAYASLSLIAIYFS